MEATTSNNQNSMVQTNRHDLEIVENQDSSHWFENKQGIDKELTWAAVRVAQQNNWGPGLQTEEIGLKNKNDCQNFQQVFHESPRTYQTCSHRSPRTWIFMPVQNIELSRLNSNFKSGQNPLKPCPLSDSNLRKTTEQHDEMPNST